MGVSLRPNATKRIKQKVEDAGITEERILEELARIAFVDPGEIFDAEGYLKPLTEMSEDARRTLSSLSVSQNQFGACKKVTMHSKMSALELLLKYRGAIVEKQEISHNVNVPQFDLEERIAQLAGDDADPLS